MSTQPTPEWQPIATAPKDGTVFEAIYQDGTTDEICWALERVHPGGSSREAACGEGWATMNEGCRYAPVDEPTYWRPLYEWHNPDGLTDEEVGVKDGWRLCLKTEREHQGCEWFGPASNDWYQHDGGNSLSPFITYRTRRPLPETSTEPKEGGAICAGDQPKSNPENLTRASNAAAGTSNPDQQAASVQLPWLEQQQRDREALAAETDQAPPQEPTAPAGAEQELMPCPFCGTEPIHVRTTDECKCRTSLCPASYMLVSRERWNRRPAAPVAVGETPLDCEQKGAEA